ncbi:efflux RND transporter periplasmic adaptor subunit [Vibrio sp. S4M6]|uniref:efflux RND transporter periplasmic adaptor subunit n=1 Tax=Vibrio sinus TaxID=2946865 RepID=UPI00202A0633|nr:efflux RND transporter periplasmic adaptor subunit [Vibrio sinus]MCL9782800.1 efflux RND transporter periplasmic adaptor subunit [Vibrio sinus]
MKIKNRPLLIVVFLIFSMVVIWFLEASSFFNPNRIHYITAPVERRDIEETVLATGVLEGAKQVTLGTQVDGQIKSIHVSVGDKVKKGQLLIEIDPEIKHNELMKMIAELKKAKASLRENEINLSNKEKTFKRQYKMKLENATSVAKLEDSRTELELYRTKVESSKTDIIKAEIQVKSAKAELELTRITAPIDGTVIAVKYEEGQTLVSRNEAPSVLTIAQLDKMVVKAKVSEADIFKVKSGLAANITTLGNHDQRYEGVLKTIKLAPDNIINGDSANSSSDNSSKAVYYSSLIEVPNLDKSLQVGMTAQVSIITNRESQVLSIPLSALNSGQNISGLKHSVRILVNDQPVEKTISTGIRDGSYVQVLSGLNDGDNIILNNQQSEKTALQTNAIFTG